MTEILEILNNTEKLIKSFVQEQEIFKNSCLPNSPTQDESRESDRTFLRVVQEQRQHK